jgi:protein-tyrosine-phosphatase
MKQYSVLFLCTGNSARSIMAEAILKKVGGDRFTPLSAGSHPKGVVHPLALRVLEEYRHDLIGMRSKSWDEFTVPGAPPLDFVFTVCDSAAGETCPIWPGQPVTAHWGVEDPAAFKGPEHEQLALFRRIYAQLDRRIRLLAVLPIGSLDRLSLQRELETIGKGG